MSESSTLIGYEGRTIPRDALALVPTPVGTETHRPIPHHEVVRALIETLGFRHIGVVHDEYAVSPDGMRLFGVLDLETEIQGCRFSIGLRNSHDKTMRLALVCGYRVFVCSNMAFSGPGDFEGASPAALLAYPETCGLHMNNPGATPYPIRSFQHQSALPPHQFGHGLPPLSRQPSGRFPSPKPAGPPH